jgi:hypothetical protein
MENTHVGIPARDYLLHGLKVGMIAWNRIDTSDR